MSWMTDLSLADQLALKPNGYFTVNTTERGQIVSIHRAGQPVERYICPSPGVANQLRMALSDMGLTGFIEGAR